MKEYRIIKLTTIDGEEKYAIEKRFLGFLWREKLEQDIDGCFVVYDSKEKAENVLKQYMYKPKKKLYENTNQTFILFIIWEMKFYHGTTKEKREKIKSEGLLRGVREVEGLNPGRCTYLSVDKEEAKQYGDIVLEVDYDPSKHSNENNYEEGCWQVRVYEPIPIENVREL